MGHAVDVQQSAARDHPFDFGAAVSIGQPAQQGDIAIGPRREIGVAPLRGRRDEPTVHPVQHRRAESCACGNQPDIPVLNGVAVLQHEDFRRLEDREAHAHRLEIVQQVDALKGEPAGQVGASTFHGTFVSAAVLLITGPATPETGAINRRDARHGAAPMNSVTWPGIEMFEAW